MALSRWPTIAALVTLATATSSPKRGLCFVPSEHHPEDDAIWVRRPGSDLTWYYNYKYEPTSDYQNVSDFEYVPMLWGAPPDGDTSTPFLDSIRSQLSSGANITHVLGFNEPDGPHSTGGSSIAPEKAADEWKRQIEPLKDEGIKLGAPAVTGSPGGMLWLDEFFTHCNGSCSVDFMPVHYYGDFQGLANKLGEVTAAYPRMEVWVTEWGFDNQDLEKTQEFYNQSVRMFDDWR